MHGGGDGGGGGGRSDRFAYDPAEKPPRYASHSTAARPPAFASSPLAPPIAQPMQDARYAAASPMQFAPVPPLPQAPPLYAQLYQQQSSRAYAQHDQQLRGLAGDRFAASYGHGPLPSAQLQQQQSFQYYPPGQYGPQPPAQQPLLPQFTSHSGYPQYAPSGAPFRAVVRRKPPRIAKRQVLLQMLQLIGFHALNAVLGVAAFSLLGSGVSSSVSLLPLCCFGIIVFRVVLYGVHVLAQLDVMLANLIARPHEQVYLEPPLAPELAGLVLAPSLASFSPLSLLALLYFLSLKFGVALLSAVSAAFTVAPLAVAVFVVCGGRNVDLAVGSARFSYQKDPVAFVVAAVCCSVIGCALMVLAAKVSTRATKFFCCESFSTYAAPTSYRQQQQQARQEQQDPRSYVFHANASYGST